MATITEARTLARPKPVLNNLTGAASIWQRELIRFFRERSRAVTSFVQPLLYLMVFGTGLGAVIQGQALGANFRVFLLPGVIVMTSLFTSMMGGFSMVWDREFGFLKEILVAPVSRVAVIAGKASGGATTSGLQSMAILIFAPIVGMHLSWWRVAVVLPILLLFAMCINLLGAAIASRTQTMQTFFVIQNFVMLPLFFLSGAIYPLSSVPTWLRVIAIADPATYAVHAIRHTLLPSFPPTSLWGSPLTVPIDVAVLAVFGSVMFVLAVRGLNRQP